MRPLHCLSALSAALLLFPAAVQADVLFKEDFESSAYSVDLPIPLDFGVIAHGRWNAVPKQSRPGVVVQEGEGHVLELRADANFSRGARVIGSLGATNDAPTTTDEAIRVSLRFKFTAPLGDTCYLQIGGSDGRSKGTLTMDDSGTLMASFGGERQPVGGVLESGRWYRVEMLLPAKPRTSSRYHVRLFEDNGDGIGQAQGRMARSMEEAGANYRFLDLQHQRTGETLYIDDLEVETIPAESVK